MSGELRDTAKCSKNWPCSQSVISFSMRLSVQIALVHSVRMPAHSSPSDTTFGLERALLTKFWLY